MNATLQSWNAASADEALEAMIACCGARRWAAAMVALRPIRTVAELSAAADRRVERACRKQIGWRPLPAIRALANVRRGGLRKLRRNRRHGRGRSRPRSRKQPSECLPNSPPAMQVYEKRFGFTYIVCATGKSAEEMLAILNRRLASDRAGELREAAEQQRQITQIRLGKWLIE